MAHPLEQGIVVIREFLIQPKFTFEYIVLRAVSCYIYRDISTVYSTNIWNYVFIYNFSWHQSEQHALLTVPRRASCKLSFI